MKKKSILIVCILCILVVGAVFVFWMNRESDTDETASLEYQGDNGSEIVVDLAVQKGDLVVYLGQVKILDSNPNVLQVVTALNESDEGVQILLDENNQILGLDNEEGSCNISIDNESVSETDIANILLKKNNGVTLYFENN